MNDFEANAWCIPMLGEGDMESIGVAQGGIKGKADFSVGVLGPGTGLGIAGLISRNGVCLPMTGEGGHMGFAPETGLQIDVLRLMRERFDRVSQERLLSGQGLENLYDCLLRLHGREGRSPGAAQIFSGALDGSDVIAAETVQLFYEILGQVSGNLVLSLGAWDGLYIAGGIVKRYPDVLKSSMFRSGFENKGRYRSLMEKVPTYLITHDEPGLLGAGHVARQLLKEEKET
jgi:glucokinase